MQDSDMENDNDNIDMPSLRKAVCAELQHIRSLGSSDNLVLSAANLGAYEALLIILSGDDSGVPVYQAVTNVRSRFSSQAGVISRIRAMRAVGLLEDRPGLKKSQVCLVPSEQLLREIGPILLARHRCGAL